MESSDPNKNQVTSITPGFYPLRTMWSKHGMMDPGESCDQAHNWEVCEGARLSIASNNTAGTAELNVKGWQVMHLVTTDTILVRGYWPSDEYDEYHWVGISGMTDPDLAD